MTGPDYRVRIPKLRRLGRLWGFIVVLFLRRFYNGPMGIIDNKKNYIYRIYRERKK